MDLPHPQSYKLCNIQCFLPFKTEKNELISKTVSFSKKCIFPGTKTQKIASPFLSFMLKYVTVLTICKWLLFLTAFQHKNFKGDFISTRFRKGRVLLLRHNMSTAIVNHTKNIGINADASV